MNESPTYPTSADWTDAPDDPDFDPGMIDDIEDADYWELHDEEEAEQFIARYLALNAI